MSPPQNFGPGTGWRQSLLQGTFRGVPFYTKSTSSEQGRRTAVHEYPLRDLPYVEDLGLKGRAFTLDAYVLTPSAEFAKKYSIGPTYMAWRDQLIAALEQPGPGELVHPYRGTLIVSLTASARIAESADEGGMARFSLTFTESGVNATPVVRPDTPAQVGKAADAAKTALNSDFSRSFSVVGMADYVAAAASAIANAALDAVTAVARYSKTGALSELLNAATSISNSLSMLMRTPQMLADAIQGQLYGLAALIDNPADAYRDLQAFFGSSTPIAAPYIPLTTPTRIQQSINQNAVIDLVRRTAIVEAARASSQVVFASYNDAQAALALLANALDAELAASKVTSTGKVVPISDEVYDALLDLRVAVVQDIGTRGANLARLTTATLPRTMPALVAAYRIYGDCTMDADLVSRNAIRAPGFVPGGVPLEILG